MLPETTILFEVHLLVFKVQKIDPAAFSSTSLVLKISAEPSTYTDEQKDIRTTLSASCSLQSVYGLPDNVER